MAILRQSLNLVAVFAMIFASNVEAIFGIGRSIAEQSDLNDTLLVPTGLAFSIWGPIFLGLVAYAVIQGLPSNRHRSIFADTGWWTALAMGSTALWGLAASLIDNDISRWLTALLFIPIVWGAVRATRLFSNDKHRLSTLESWLCWAPVSLYAGWVSLAAFLNWCQVGTYTGFGLGLPKVVIALLCLALTLAFAAWQLHRNRGNKVYAFSIVWGLAFLAYARFAVDDLNAVIGTAAVVGLLVVMFSTVYAGRRQQPLDI